MQGLLKKFLSNNKFGGGGFSVTWALVGYIAKRRTTRAGWVSPWPDHPDARFPCGPPVEELCSVAIWSPRMPSTIRGFTLGYDVIYDISPASATEDADFDGDGDVDGADFLTWQRGFGVGTDLSAGDANDDNVVDGADLTIWRDQFGPTASLATMAQIPEPAGAALLVIGCIAMLADRRRRS